MDKRLLVRLFVPVRTKAPEKKGKVGKTGTGYPVSPELILTAAHVVCPRERDTNFPIEVPVAGLSRWTLQRMVCPRRQGPGLAAPNA